VSTEHSGRHDPGVHGGRSVRQVVQAEKAHANASVQQKRRDMPKGRYFVSHVPRRRHEKITYYRGARQGAIDKEKSECVSYFCFFYEIPLTDDGPSPTNRTTARLGVIIIVVILVLKSYRL